MSFSSKESCHILILAVLVLPIHGGYIFFLIFGRLLGLKLAILCVIEGVRGILVWFWEVGIKDWGVPFECDVSCMFVHRGLYSTRQLFPLPSCCLSLSQDRATFPLEGKSLWGFPRSRTMMSPDVKVLRLREEPTLDGTKQGQEQPSWGPSSSPDHSLWTLVCVMGSFGIFVSFALSYLLNGNSISEGRRGERHGTFRGCLQYASGLRQMFPLCSLEPQPDSGSRLPAPWALLSLA